MSDFVQWFDGTGGGGDYDEPDVLEDMMRTGGSGRPGEDGSTIVVRRDAVLFLIDCNATMFDADEADDGPALPPPPAGSGGGDATASSKASPFTRAVECAARFYQEKAVTSDKDFVGVILYHTEKHLNTYGFPGVFVFHDFDVVSAPRIQELQILARAGQVGNAVHKEFLSHIGHGKAATATTATAGGGKAVKGPLLSEALWAAQHTFHALRESSSKSSTSSSSSSVTKWFRRIFLFTNQEDPTVGVKMERERCFARMNDLHDAGVSLEVFAHGGAATSTTTTRGGPAELAAVKPPSTPPSAAAAMKPSLSPPSSPPHLHHHHTAAAASGGFRRELFWEPLVLSPLPASVFGPSGGRLTGSSTLYGDTEDEQSDQSTDYTGTVHVSDAMTSFDAMIGGIRLRTHPQRSSGGCELRIGFDGIGGAPSPPSMYVQFYLPVMKASKPKFCWLDSATNALVSTETRYLSKETGAVVTPAEMQFSTSIAGETLFFQKSEQTALRTAVAGSGLSSSSTSSAVDSESAAGKRSSLTVLGFKTRQDAIKWKHSVGRSCFVHCSASRGGGAESHAFFVQLHRTLTAQGKVAIAEYVSRPGVAPRLVALVPSSLNDPPLAVEPVTGLGFYLTPLPYADDIRSLPSLKTAEPHHAKEPEVTRAKKIIKKLTVSYDPLSIPNPGLQRQYRVLQRAALLEEPSSSTSTTSAELGDDLTLPDAEGMQKFHPLYKDFKEAVLPPHYNASAVCPAPKPAKAPPTIAELQSINFDALEKAGNLESLTIPYLSQYLKLWKEDTHGATLKKDLAERVGQVVRKRRAVKREREEGE